ncbi:MAG: ABC transporter ATP-binding protein [Silvanigrellales bacterium]|jgi:putative ABC transport system ATP-binding protein|nr:ABC transporter ATP-binding protein [Silvanigrellales bacterium]
MRTPDPAGAPLLELHGLRKSYKLGEVDVHALNDLSLTLRVGEFTALVGASGSGKSTLLNMAGLIDEPDEGEVLLEGVNVARLSDDARSLLRNEKLGFIFQSFNLLPVLDVGENVELPLLLRKGMSPLERRDRVDQALEDVGLGSLKKQVPDKLSGGQRQRVAIARALVTHPALVLADEPTANLDSETTHRIVDLMIDLNAKRGVTFLFSTHDEKLMQRVNRIVHIRDGKIVNGKVP